MDNIFFRMFDFLVDACKYVGFILLIIFFVVLMLVTFWIWIPVLFAIALAGGRRA